MNGQQPVNTEAVLNLLDGVVGQELADIDQAAPALGIDSLALVTWVVEISSLLPLTARDEAWLMSAAQHESLRAAGEMVARWARERGASSALEGGHASF